jgi:hypothetical protein
MRELTKSTMSAGLAMSLFGMQVMRDAFRRTQAGGPSPAVEDLDAVTQAMVDRTGDMLRETFHVADKFQRGLVDITFGWLTLAPLRSTGGMSTMADTTRQVTEGMRRWMDSMGMRYGGGSDCGCADAASTRPGTWSTTATSQPRPGGAPGQGWGPMPNQS